MSLPLPLPPVDGRHEGGRLLRKQFGDLIPDKLWKWLKHTAVIKQHSFRRRHDATDRRAGNIVDLQRLLNPQSLIGWRSDEQGTRRDGPEWVEAIGPAEQCRLFQNGNLVAFDHDANLCRGGQFMNSHGESPLRRIVHGMDASRPDSDVRITHDADAWLE